MSAKITTRSQYKIHSKPKGNVSLKHNRMAIIYLLGIVDKLLIHERYWRSGAHLANME